MKYNALEAVSKLKTTTFKLEFSTEKNCIINEEKYKGISLAIKMHSKQVKLKGSI